MKTTTTIKMEDNVYIVTIVKDFIFIMEFVGAVRCKVVLNAQIPQIVQHATRHGVTIWMVVLAPTVMPPRIFL